MITVLGWIRDISTFRHFRVSIGQTFKVDPLSINTLVTIMSSHLTTMCMAKVWSIPYGGNSSSEKETWLVANTNDTIPLIEESIILVGTYISFNTFYRASWWTLEDNNMAKIEIGAGDLFNYLTFDLAISFQEFLSFFNGDPIPDWLGRALANLFPSLFLGITSTTPIEHW